jgi:hypothetical protein
MNMITSKRSATLCRWTARILGVLLLSVVVLLAIGEGMPNPLTQPGRVQVGFLALALLLVGILVGWRWELAGGLMSLAGWFIFVFAVCGLPRGINPFMFALALPGALYLASVLWRRYAERHLVA